jgi:CheY-like chemotaxis protein/HPt (histidine-containing phosphotransfer) domain-containing protein
VRAEDGVQVFVYNGGLDFDETGEFVVSRGPNGRKRYDIVLMEVEMPVMDGLEASRRIHREWTGKDRPRIIAMTANAMQGDRDTCVNAGMDDYLSKPIHADELAAALGRAIPHSAVQEMRDTDVLDDSALEHLDVATGDPAFVADLVDTFLREAPVLVAGLKTARQSGDAEEVRRAAHTPKSNARTFGAAGLANRCQELENTAKRQVMSEAAGLVTKYRGRVRVSGERPCHCARGAPA